jgi:uroporphyrinogen decarboxylase
MLMTGTDGIDTLDPPPLGNVELEEAKALLGESAFIKGNIDPVNTLLNGSPNDVAQDAKNRLAIGKPRGGYILSTACSVAPKTPPENIETLYETVLTHGSY